MILTHGSVHREVIDLIEQAQNVLVLVSPYLAPWKGLVMAIERASARGVAIHMILRGGEDRERQASAVAPLRSRLRTVRFVERLHAKIYLSEKAAVLTSMNLLESSALDSIEFAARVDSQQHTDGYRQAFKVCEALMAMAEQEQLREKIERGANASASMPTARTEKPIREPRRKNSAGHCIRCGEEVAQNPEKPLCAACFRLWSKYENPDYEEDCCHMCGRKASTSMRKPLCRTCYAAAA